MNRLEGPTGSLVSCDVLLTNHQLSPECLVRPGHSAKHTGTTWEGEGLEAAQVTGCVITAGVGSAQLAPILVNHGLLGHRHARLCRGLWLFPSYNSRAKELRQRCSGL